MEVVVWQRWVVTRKAAHAHILHHCITCIKSSEGHRIDIQEGHTLHCATDAASVDFRCRCCIYIVAQVTVERAADCVATDRCCACSGQLTK